MQLDYHRRALVVLSGVVCLRLAAGQAAPEKQGGCTAQPLQVTLKHVRIYNEDPLTALLRIGSQGRICMGFEAAEYVPRSTSLEEDNVRVSSLLERLFPDFSMSTTQTVVNLRQVNRERTWLDYRLKRFEIGRVSLVYSSYQVFLFVKGELRPGGYLGDVGESVPENEVGPFVERNATVRELLNLLVAESSGGGMWVVKMDHPRTDAFPDDQPFWTMHPYPVQRSPN
jgi:hypothetical protein